MLNKAHQLTRKENLNTIIEKAGKNQKRKDCGLQVFFKVNQILEMNKIINTSIDYYRQSPGNQNKQLSFYVI